MLRWITAHNEYQEFFKSNRLLRSKHFFVPVLENIEGEFALGITISKRIGKAVVRNLLKRRIKAYIRSQNFSLLQGKKANLIAKTGCGELSWQLLCMELEQIIGNLAQEINSAK